MNLETTQKVPLTLWKDGTIRVKGSRLLIDTIINAHCQGMCPEEILESFPSEVYKIADIYSIIAFYLQNKAKLNKYLADRKKAAEKVWGIIESDRKYQARLVELSDLKGNR